MMTVYQEDLKLKSQTLNLLKKEIALGNGAQTTCWTICCFCMYFIPHYPMYVGPFYIMLCVMMTFAMNQSSHDILYTVLLPVKKSDVVKARFLYSGMLEFFALDCALVGGLVRYLVHYPANKAGIEIGICYFGLQLILLALFNLIYLGNVYKDPLKSGVKFLFAAIAYFIGLAVCELPVWTYFAMRGKLEAGEINELTVLGKLGMIFISHDSQYIIPQLGILAAGILIYVLGWYLSFRRGSCQFDKYDM